MRLKPALIHRKIPFTMVLLCLCGSSVAQKAAPQLIDCSKNSPINNSTTTDDLMNKFGASQVLNGRVNVGEGETQPGVMVFPGDPKRRLAITWGQRTKALPMIVRISGKETTWTTFAGIGIGMTLKQIEKINGRPFILTGFGWDYDGAVKSWRSG